MFDRTGRRLGDRRVKADRPPLRNDHGMYAGGIRDAQDRTKVIAFLQFIENQKERRFSPSAQCRHKGVQIRVFMDSHLGNDSLVSMGFRHLVQDRPFYVQDNGARCARQCDQAYEGGIRFAFPPGHPELVDRSAGPDRFQYRIAPFQAVR